MHVLINQHPKFQVVSAPDLLNGIDEIKTDAQVLSYGNDGCVQAQNVGLTLIPYYAWANRGEGYMNVWMAQDVSAINLSSPETK